MFSRHLCYINHKTKLAHTYRQLPSNFKLRLILHQILPNVKKLLLIGEISECLIKFHYKENFSDQC